MMLKQELIDEVNDLLDSLSPVEAKRILGKLTAMDLIRLRRSIEQAIADARSADDREPS